MLNMNLLYELIGLISGILGLSIAVPQLYRIIKAKTHEGVSIATWVVSLGNFSIWAAYSARYNSPSQLLTNVIACILTTFLVYILIRQAKNVSTAILVVLATIGMFTGLGFFTPEWLMTVILFTMVLVGRIPQIIASRSHYKNNQQTVVSKTTYTLIICSSVGWITYGTLTGLWQNIVASSIGLLTSAVVLYYETRER